VPATIARACAAKPLRLAVEEPDADGEDDVEAAVAEVDVLQGRHEELGASLRDVLGVPAPRWSRSSRST
jgi:hypothetical protein